MFVSKERAIIIPQSEHLRLCGTIANHWGNAEFRLPNINRGAFVTGVATHDRAFGFLDKSAVGEITDEERKHQVQVWLDTAYNDPVTELVVLFHVRRLMKNSDLEDLTGKLDDRIRSIAEVNPVDLTAIEQADTITAFCDVVSFDFCFESEVTRKIPVFCGEVEARDIIYTVKDRKITFDPWPFSVPSIKDYILGYE